MSEPLRVVIVDDEPLARDAIKVLLKKDPEVRVVGAASGADAAALIARTHPDLMFLDIQMPEVDGFALLEQIGPETVPAIVFVKTFIDERFPNPPPQFDFGVVNRAFQAREVLLRIVLLGINVHAQLRVCVKCNFEKYHQMISTSRHDVDRRNPACPCRLGETIHGPAFVEHSARDWIRPAVKVLVTGFEYEFCQRVSF